MIGDIPSCETYHLVKDAQRITHAAISFLGDEVKRFGLGRITFLLGYVSQMVDRVLDGHSREVIHLTTAEDSGRNLMFLRGGQDEDDIGRGLLQCLQKGVEGLCGEHVYLVDDEYLIFPSLRRNANLVANLTDVVDRVVGGGVQLVYVHGTLFLKGAARLACVTGLTVGCRLQAVYCLGKDAGASGLSYTAWTAEQVGVSQFARTYGIQ